MLLKTIINQEQKCESFLYKQARWPDGRETLEIELAERANARPACSGCGKLRPGYDRLAPRRFEFAPLWGLKGCLVYGPGRVRCPACGVRGTGRRHALGDG